MPESLKGFMDVISAAPIREEAAEGHVYRIHPGRSDVRYKLFRYRTTGDVLVPGLVEHFEKQFRKGWTWDNFSCIWDVSPSDPFRAISEMEWLSEGGVAIEPREGELFTVARFHPNAFTRQAR